jgi:hypothetical protein
VSRRFLLDVLRASGMPASALRAVEALYRNTSCDLSLGGQRFTGFSATAGIRQGCPLSPLLFSVATSALVRRLGCLPGTTARAYADDTATVVTRWEEEAPAVVKLFMDFSAASGMLVNFEKTVVVPAGPAAWATVDRWMQEMPPPQRMPLRTYGKYLGILVGPEAEAHAWSVALRKYEARVADWQWRKLGLHLAIRIYNIYLHSTLAFLAQFYAPSEQVLATERRVVAKVLGGPAGSLTLEEASALRDAYGFPTQIARIEHTALAAKLRVNTWEARRAGGAPCEQLCRRVLEHARHTGYDPPDARQLCWWMGGIPANISAGCAQLAAQGITFRGLCKAHLPAGRSSPRELFRFKGRTQALASEAIRKRKREYWRPGVVRRVQRWAPHNADRGGATRVTRHCQQLRKLVPPRVLAGVIAALHNRWCTDRRLRQQHRARPCLLCGSPEGDSLEHYACCSQSKRLARRLGLPTPTSLLPMWLGLEVLTPPLRSGAAVCCYAVMRTVHALRAQPLRQRPLAIHRVLWQAVHDACRGHAVLGRRWTSRLLAGAAPVGVGVPRRVAEDEAAPAGVAAVSAGR